MQTSRCPKCNNSINSTRYGIDTWAEGNNATFDCHHCKALLIVKCGVPICFHQWMNASDPSWPVDGNQTGYVEL